MRDFQISPAGLRRLGTGLSRPECVLATVSGDLYVSDARGGVTLIRPDGSQINRFGVTDAGEPLGANGFALLPDGSLLIAPLCGGAVWQLDRTGQARNWLDEADGVAFGCPNFVLLDDLGRIWICLLTREDRTAIRAFPRTRRDGFIVLVDDQGARIVADDIGYPNEVRIDPTGRWLYTNETVAARLLRYPIRPDGSLGPMEVVHAFDESNLFDGFALDAEGGAWITTLVSNRLWHVSPDGEASLVFEDSSPEQLARLVEAQTTTGVTRAILYEDPGSRLPNIASIAFGGPGCATAYLGNLMGDAILTFPAPVPGQRPAHWNFGPF